MSVRAMIMPGTVLWLCVARGYGRAKDSILQIEWDEPLSLAVRQHHRRSSNKSKE